MDNYISDLHTVSSSLVYKHNSFINTELKDEIYKNERKKILFALFIPTSLSIYTVLRANSHCPSINLAIFYKWSSVLGALIYISLRSNEIKKKFDYIDVMYPHPSAAQIALLSKHQ